MGNQRNSLFCNGEGKFYFLWQRQRPAARAFAFSETPRWATNKSFFFCDSKARLLDFFGDFAVSNPLFFSFLNFFLLFWDFELDLFRGETTNKRKSPGEIGLHCGFVCCRISLFLRLFTYFLFMKIQKHLNVRKPNLSKFGHRASGIGHRASGIGHRASAISLFC